MATRAEQIFYFLPLKYPSIENDEYVTFWWNSYLKNKEEENFHLALLSFHMLYMTAVYFLLFKISRIYRSTYENSLFHMGNEEEERYLNIGSAFSFSNMNEKTVFRFLTVAGAGHALIGEVSKFIEHRNNAAHAKGLIYFNNDPDGLEARVIEYVNALEKIQNLFIKESQKISEDWKISKMNTADLQLFIENEITKNYLTPAEIRAVSLREAKRNPKLQKELDKFIEDYFDNG